MATSMTPDEFDAFQARINEERRKDKTIGGIYEPLTKAKSPCLPFDLPVHRTICSEADGWINRMTEAKKFLTPSVQDTPLVTFFTHIRKLRHEHLHTFHGVHKADAPTSFSQAFYCWISDTVDPPHVWDLPVIAWVKPGLPTGPELWMLKENWDEWVRVYRYYHLCNDAPDNIDPAGFNP